MNTSKTTRILLSALLVAATASLSAFAGTTGGSSSTSSSASYRLPVDARLGGVELKKGDYRVEWSGEGADVQVAVRKGKTEMVKVAGQVVPLDKKEDGDTLLTRADGAGAPVATEIRFAGKRVALKLSATPLTADAGSAAPKAK